MKIIIILLSHLYFASAFLDYTPDNQIYCNQIQSYSKPQLWHTLILHELDMYGFLLLCPIAIICSLFIVFTYYKYPTTRKPPGDIFLAISLIDLFLASSWFYYGVYASFNDQTLYDIDQMPDDFTVNCAGLSIIGVFLGTAQVVYNCCFSIYLIISVKNTLKGKVKQWYYHVFSIIGILGFTILVVLIHENGLSIFGTCTFALQKHIPYSGVVVVGLYTLFSIVALFIFKRSIPKGKQLNQIRNYFIKYYFLYIISNAVIWMTLAASNLILILNCVSSNPNSSLQIFATIGNLSKLGTPIILSVVRFKNPSISQALRNYFRKFKNHIRQIFGGQISLNEESGINQSLLNVQKTWLDQIKKNVRSRQIYSLLSGIQKISSLPGNQQKQLSLMLQPIDQKDEKTLKYKVIQHFPCYSRLFRPKNYLTSFNPELNIQQIFKEGNEGDGGKSGQFFYYTQDKNFIIKTITNEQVQVYKKRMESFYEYYKNNQNCLIVKILGIYTFIKQDNNAPLYIIWMKNLAPTQKSNIYRAFDLKGSKYNRQVLKQKKKKQIELQSFISTRKYNKTLKDIDFIKMERRIYLQPEVLYLIQTILNKDIDFLKDMKLIDYSLIVIICAYTQIQAQRISKLVDSQTVHISEVEQLYYHFGIVDYLQLWNLQKNMQKKTKQIINLGKSIDTSAQDEVFYARRFKQKVISKLFSPKDDDIKSELSQKSDKS